jgi:hypothetical protein
LWEKVRLQIPRFDKLSSSLSDLGVEDRVVSKTLSRIERSEIEPPKTGMRGKKETKPAL